MESISLLKHMSEAWIKQVIEIQRARFRQLDCRKCDTAMVSGK
jgi:hypothetical protein